MFVNCGNLHLFGSRIFNQRFIFSHKLYLLEGNGFNLSEIESKGLVDLLPENIDVFIAIIFHE